MLSLFKVYERDTKRILIGISQLSSLITLIIWSLLNHVPRTPFVPSRLRALRAFVPYVPSYFRAFAPCVPYLRALSTRLARLFHAPYAPYFCAFKSF